ncbi:MAG: hypothetical protein R3F02_17695 [Thiolinea sp.]
MKALKGFMYGAGGLLLLAVTSACVQLDAGEQPPADSAERVSDSLVRCTTPRPEICYELYQPVCAVRDTGVRCVTTPCPSTEKITYANDCKACADPKVFGFQRGDCNAMNTSSLDEKLRQWLGG